MKTKTFRYFILWISKVLLAGIISFAVLNTACLLYYNIPNLDYDTQGVTTFKLKPNTIYSVATEGYGWGRTNNDGYMNAFDYEDGMDVDVLILGSSHIQSFQVPLKENAATVLDSLLPDDVVYSVAIGGHYLKTCLACMPAALEKYSPSKYVVIETSNIMLTDSEIMEIIEGKPQDAFSRTGKLAAILRKSPYLRLLNNQLKIYQSVKSDRSEQEETYNDPELLDALLSKLARTASENDVKMIIAYHPGISIRNDGGLDFDLDERDVRDFSERCENHGIYFLDLSDRILREYRAKHILPYGFANSIVGKGHSNSQGLKMFAEEVAEFINGLAD